MVYGINLNFSKIDTHFGKRILIKKKKMKEQMKIFFAAQHFEIFKFHRHAKFYNNIMELKENAIPFGV